jgi:hypothetical protein
MFPLATNVPAGQGTQAVAPVADPLVLLYVLGSSAVLQFAQSQLLPVSQVHMKNVDVKRAPHQLGLADGLSMRNREANLRLSAERKRGIKQGRTGVAVFVVVTVPLANSSDALVAAF